jgi:PTS system nitrogen regulatory IIA component
MKRNTEILSPKEVAELLGLPLVTIQRWEHQGKIPFKLTRNQKWYKRKEIMEWAELHDMMIREESAGKTVKTGEILSQAVERGGIHHGVGGSDIYTVFQHALDHLPYLENTDRGLILNELLNREELASTAIGNGIAIPHTRERLDLGLKAVYIPVLFLENPVEFNAIDAVPVFVLFMIFTANTGDHLKILSRIGYALKDQGVVQILNERNRDNNLLTKISEIEQRIKK